MSKTLSQIEAVDVEISVVLGRSVLPMSQLLRMGRGAVIPLDASEHDEVWILANNHPVARGEIEIHRIEEALPLAPIIARHHRIARYHDGFTFTVEP